MKEERKCDKDLEQRQVKYLNNVIEADHGKLKQLIKPVRGFKTMKAAYATIKGFEVMHALRKGQGRAFNLTRDPIGEKRLCCTNDVRDSLFESSVVAGEYEQLAPYEIQN